MRTMKDFPVFTISQFEDYNHCQHCGNTFYVRTFNQHLLENTFLDQSHGHDFFILLLVTHGSGTHTIDFNSYDVKPHTVFFLSPGQVHHWNLSTDVEGYILFFTKEYLLIDFNQNTLAKLPFFFSQMNEPYLLLDEAAEAQMLRLFRNIDAEYQERKRFFHDMIRLNLKMLLIGLERTYKPKSAEPLMKYQQLQIQRLEALIDTYFKEYRSVSKYADLMNLSIKQLNTLCKKAFNKTSGDLIQQRVILEAKRLLIHSDYPVGVVSELLNYTDASYFIRQFRKVTNMTPEQFRATILTE